MFHTLLNVLVSFVVGYNLLCNLPSRSDRVDALARQKWFTYAAVFLITYSSCKNILIAGGVTACLTHYFLA